MKNIFGKREDLQLYREDGKLAYVFRIGYNNCSWEATYDNQGNQTSCKNSNGYSYEATYDEKGNETSYKDSRGISWKKTFDDQNRITSYKDSSDTYWKRIYKEDGTYKQINL